MSLGLKTIPIGTCLLLAVGLTAPGQNLAINGGFESGNTCQEFNLPCGPSAWVTLPVATKVVFYGTDGKKDANHHFGLVLENIKTPFTARSYVQTMLCRPLEAGQRYRLTLRCRTRPAPFERVGVLLAADEIIDGIDTLAFLKASFDITADSLLPATGSGGWRTAQYTFTAAGGEQFLVLGNFSAAYSPRNPEYTHDILGNIVLSIDDVSLLPLQPPSGADTGCIGLERSLYARHQRHTRFIYLLGEPRKAATVAAAQINKPQPPPADVAVAPPPVKTDSVVTGAPPVAPRVYDTLLRIPFDVNSSLLDAGYTHALDSVLQKVVSGPFKSILIIGHTDNTGPGWLNQALSLHRARAVADYFIRKERIPVSKVQVLGRADGEPLAGNDTEDGRQKNRRVEVIVRR